jgi:hypothetical protein
VLIALPFNGACDNDRSPGLVEAYWNAVTSIGAAG